MPTAEPSIEPVPSAAAESASAPESAAAKSPATQLANVRTAATPTSTPAAPARSEDVASAETAYAEASRMEQLIRMMTEQREQASHDPFFPYTRAHVDTVYHRGRFLSVFSEGTHLSLSLLWPCIPTH